jgi:hypothetical protein
MSQFFLSLLYFLKYYTYAELQPVDILTINYCTYQHHYWICGGNTTVKQFACTYVCDYRNKSIKITILSNLADMDMVKVKLSLCLTKHYAMKAHEGVDV